MRRMEMVENKDTLEFLYARAVLLKLYKAKVISRKVYEIAERKCRERLN
jgi:hypothetical protein